MNTDSIIIKELHLRTIVGVYPHEQLRARSIIININITTNLHHAGISDSLFDTIDYDALIKEIKLAVESKKYLLIESVAHTIATICLSPALAAAVVVEVYKPKAVPNTKSVAVSIRRTKGGL